VLKEISRDRLPCLLHKSKCPPLTQEQPSCCSQVSDCTHQSLLTYVSLNLSSGFESKSFHLSQIILFISITLHSIQITCTLQFIFQHAWFDVCGYYKKARTTILTFPHIGHHPVMTRLRHLNHHVFAIDTRNETYGTSALSAKWFTMRTDVVHNQIFPRHGITLGSASTTVLLGRR